MNTRIVIVYYAISTYKVFGVSVFFRTLEYVHRICLRRIIRVTSSLFFDIHSAQRNRNHTLAESYVNFQPPMDTAVTGTYHTSALRDKTRRVLEFRQTLTRAQRTKKAYGTRTKRFQLQNTVYLSDKNFKKKKI